MTEGSPSAAERESAPESAPDPAPAPASPSRKEWLMPLAIIAVAMIVLTVLSTSAVLWIGNGTSQPSYAPGTPEATMQAFVDAYEKGDYVTADSYLSSRLKSEGMTTRMSGMGGSGMAAVTITAGGADGDMAKLQVEVTRTYNSGLGMTSSSYLTTVMLVREGGSWKIDSESAVTL